MKTFELTQLAVSLRVVGTPEEPLFVASDLAKALGYRDSNDMLRSLDADEIAAPQNVRVRSSDGTEQYRKTNLINEMGMWHSIQMSRRPEAKQVRNWINGEVMPAIRKTGSYVAPKFEVPTTLSAALRLAADQAEVIEAQTKQLEAAKPAIAFADRHASATNLFSFRSAAKMLKFKEVRFIDAMLRDGLLYRDAKRRLVPYAEKQHSGLFDVVTGESHGIAYLQTKITAAGLQKLADMYASELGE